MKKKRKKPKPEERIKRKGVVPFEARVRIVQAVMRGSRQADVAVAFGVSVAVIQKFMTLFETGGMDALRIQPSGAAVEKAKRRVEQAMPRDEVVAMREANPEWGTRRIRDVLARFEGLGVSETTVRRILHEEGLLVERAYEAPRDKPVRRFERAEPNQLWQSTPARSRQQRIEHLAALSTPRLLGTRRSKPTLSARSRRSSVVARFVAVPQFREASIDDGQIQELCTRHWVDSEDRSA